MRAGGCSIGARYRAYLVSRLRIATGAPSQRPTLWKPQWQGGGTSTAENSLAQRNWRIGILNA
jgi:hypothetical protein